MKKKSLMPLALAAIFLFSCTAGESSSEAPASQDSSATSSQAASTAASSNQASSAASQDSGLPTPTDTTIAALNKLTATDTTHLYKVSGILEGYEFDKYGNGYLTDPASGETIKIYGSSLAADTGLTYEGGVLGYTNKQAGASVEGHFDNGDYVTMLVQYQYYQGYSGNTPEILGHFDSKGENSYTYAASIEVNNAAYGTATLGKTSGIAYGEAVTITATPADGYGILGVTLETAYGTDNTRVKVGADGSYSFLATCVNKVTVNFGVVSTDSLTLTVDNLGLPTSSYGDTTATVSGVSISCDHTYNGGKGIQMRINNGTASAIYNTTATPKEIASIVLNYNAEQSSTKALLYVAFGTASCASTTSGTSISYSGSAATVTPSSTGNTYFKVAHSSTSGAVYLDSIVINYVA